MTLGVLAVFFLAIRDFYSYLSQADAKNQRLTMPLILSKSFCFYRKCQYVFSGRYGLSPKLPLQGGEVGMFIHGNILLWSFQRAMLRTEVFH